MCEEVLGKGEVYPSVTTNPGLYCDIKTMILSTNSLQMTSRGILEILWL